MPPVQVPQSGGGGGTSLPQVDAGPTVDSVAGTVEDVTDTVQGTVGPSFTIKLTLAGKKVTRLKKGVRYRFLILDRSSIHDFHLLGPGVNRVLTSVDFTGTKSVVLRLRKGTYRFVCDPHAFLMHGSFRVA